MGLLSLIVVMDLDLSQVKVVSTFPIQMDFWMEVREVK
jgi:hypothetical protein